MSISATLNGEIVARLRETFDGAAQVEEFPSQPDPKRFVHPKAAVWVGYAGSSYGLPGSLGTSTQARELHFDVSVLTRQLHGGAGASAFLEAVREVMHGHRLSHGSKLWIQRDGFEAYKDGVWRHVIVLALSMPSVPANFETQAPLAPSLVRLRFEHGTEQFDVSEAHP